MTEAFAMVVVGALALFGNMFISVISADSTKKAMQVQINELKEDISRLEKKQDKHNGIVEKTYKTEESVKSAHKRIDELVK